MSIEKAKAQGRRLAAAEDGFTILEVIITAVVVIVVMLATFGALEAAGRAGSEQRHRAESYAIAQQDQARMRAMQISQVNGLDQTRVVTQGDTDYTVRSTGSFVNDVTGTASCEEGTNSSDYLSITTTVTWPAIGGKPPTVIKGIVAPPAGSLSETTGALSFVVRDGAGTGTPGVSVTGSGASTFSGTTGPTGCILFANLPEGNYTLTPGSSGVVDPDGAAPSPIPTSVVGQSTNTVVVRYDTPGRINVNFTTRINGSVQATTQDTISAFNSGYTNVDLRSFGTVGTRSSTVQATSMFPFASPYAVYAGSCASNNPNPDELANPPAAAAMANVNVLPNQTASATIQLPALNLVVRSGTSGTTPLAGARVRITDVDCLVNGNPVVRTYTTNASGKLDTPGLPYGTYNVCANTTTGTTRKNSVNNVAVETTATDTNATIYLGSGASGSSGGACP